MVLIYWSANLPSRGNGAIFILASCKYQFIRVYENLVQHPRNHISIKIYIVYLRPRTKILATKVWMKKKINKCLLKVSVV